MNREEIKVQLLKIIDPYIDEKGVTTSVSEKSDLINDLNINSAHLVDIVLDIEEEFDIIIEDDYIGKMDTVGSALDIIEEKIK
ncbi:MAG: acyl carrier protein [Flammeovirgaceae bacterium]|nr:acyl carrier protein [Flammeovirgaceae bacterium]MBE62536.1 acyl carrier protein [Flammeovirgaceae bacterium]MBR08989.1 acyl carrier protein [Rickettsiales bacterium]|tara:strand:+ start:41 stop:289 length:249 start_codon:yes stop_codon:yes gene_type:complete